MLTLVDKHLQRGKLIMMQLIDVTNSYSRMIHRELIESPAHFIKVYTLGNSKVVYKKKHAFSQIVITNKEIDLVKEKLLKDKASQATVTRGEKAVEIVVDH